MCHCSCIQSSAKFCGADLLEMKTRFVAGLASPAGGAARAPVAVNLRKLGMYPLLGFYNE